MKRPKWSARLLYIAVALALVISFMPAMTATPALAQPPSPTISISGPSEATQGETVEFVATLTPPTGTVEWFIGDELVGTDTTLSRAFPVGVFIVIAEGSWEGGEITRQAEHVITVGPGLMPHVSYNIIGSRARFDVPDTYHGDIVQWRFQPSVFLGNDWSIVEGGASSDDTHVIVQGHGWGMLRIFVDLLIPGEPDESLTLSAAKKWGKIYDTHLYGEGETEIVWNNEAQKWTGTDDICDEVIGEFITDGGFRYTHLADGSDLQWWILRGDAPVYDLPSSAIQTDLVAEIEDMQAAYPSRHVGFGDCDTKYMQTQTTDGRFCLTLVACGPEAVKIVVVAKYQDLINEPGYFVFPQILSWNFWSQQREKVPQVAWAGEKVVLEKYFGTSYIGEDVLFALESPSVGTLVPIDEDYPGGTTVWTEVDKDGVARVIIESETHGEAHVKATLYYEGYPMKNQHGFVVYYLALDSVSLGNVEGEREGHDSGLFVPENPWDTSTDTSSTTLNVSQDTLLRARVRGWFIHSVYKSMRPALTETVEVNGQTWEFEIAPAGRIVLPDDWWMLAAGPQGYSRWQQLAPHWDIMTQPNDNVMSLLDPLGPYHEWDFTGPNFAVPGALVAVADVIGPYSNLDDYTPNISRPEALDRKTIVPNAKLNWWDCPMPPAKVAFQIMEGPGFFKEADKTDIYYQWVQHYWDLWDIAYTNPFYQMMIPASPFIPPFINNGGYDWDSWGFEGRERDPNGSSNNNVAGHEFGPYPFWEFINTTDNPNAPTSNPAQRPTWVWVYSDNHGEAMVYLNGDWNLDLGRPPYDIPTGTEVGETTVEAIAHYPYLRDYGIVVSDPVEKTWEWGVDIRGYGHFGDDWRMVIQTMNIDGTAPDATTGLSNMKMAFLWITDRDGQPLEGIQVDWHLSSHNGALGQIANYNGFPGALASVYGLEVVDGFLAGTGGETLNPERSVGRSYTIIPDSDGAEVYLWDKRWGVDPPRNHGVAGVLVHVVSLSTHVELKATIHHPEGKLTRTWNLDFQEADPQNPCIVDFRVFGDITGTGYVDAADILALYDMINARQYAEYADVNGDGKLDIGDVITVQKIITRG